MNDRAETFDTAAMDVSDTEIQAYERGELELCEILELDDGLMDQLRGRAQFFLDGGHDERALIMLEMLEELDRRDTLATLLAIETTLRLGLSDRAEEKVAKLEARTPNEPDVLLARAQLELSAGRWHAAASSLEQVLERDPEATREVTRRARVLAHAAYERFETAR